MALVQRRGRGFTLVELIAVMAIMAILLLAITPALDNMLPSYRLKGGARIIASNIELAQSEAITRRKEFVLAYGAILAGLVVFASGLQLAEAVFATACGAFLRRR